MNLGNYIDKLKAVFVARNGLSDIGYKDWYSWGNGELKDAYLKKYAAQLKGLNLEQANLALSTQLLSNSQKEAILVEAGLVASKDKIKASLVESALAQNIDSEATQKAILKKLNLTQANGVLIASDKECTEADLRRVLTEANIIGVEQERIVTATGVATAQTGEITSTTGTSLCEAELSNTNLYGIEVNTENDIVSDDYDENFPTIFYRELDVNLYNWNDPKYNGKYLNYTNDQKLKVLKRGSLLHRLLDKVPNYSIKYVQDVSYCCVISFYIVKNQC